MDDMATRKQPAPPITDTHYVETRQPAYAVMWPDEQQGPWIFRAHWAQIAGRMECVGLEMRAYRERWEKWASHRPLEVASPEPALSAETWRAVPIASVIATLRARMREEMRDWLREREEHAQEDPAFEVWREVAQSAVDTWEAGRLANASMLEQTAAVYKDAWESGQHPTQQVAEHFVITPSAAAKRVARAREAGFLPPTTRGRPAGGAKPGSQRRKKES